MARRLLLGLCCLFVSACGAAAPPAPTAELPGTAPAAPSMAATELPEPTTPVAASSPQPSESTAENLPATPTTMATRLLLLQDPPLTGADVLAIQERLRDLGYAEVGAADGIFGPRSDATVRRFQATNNLEVDGVVGPQTLAALNNSEARRGDAPVAESAPAIMADAGLSNWLIGAGSSGSWLEPAQVNEAQIAGTYTLYTLDGPLEGLYVGLPGPPPDPLGGPCFDLFTIEVLPAPAAVAAERPIAVKAPWNPLPRRPELLDPANPTYVEIVAERLRDQGIAQPDVQIERIVRVDLEGDGTDEVLISATRHEPGSETIGIFAAAGDYSFVLLRRVVDGTVVTVPLIEEYFVESSDTMITTTNRLLALLDLNGDGRMEAVVASDYYEGASTLVFELDETRARQVLSVACGV